MLKNPLYIYGPKTVTVPSDLNFGSYILSRLWNYKDKVALINGATEESITYGEIAQQSMNFAVSLTRLGVRKDEVVALFSENRKEYFGAVIGVACSGAVLTTITCGYGEEELKHFMNVSKPKYMIISQYMYKAHEKLIRTTECIKKIIVFGNEKFPSTLSFDGMVVADGRETEDVKYENFLAVDVKGHTDTLFIVYSSGTTGLPKGVMLTHVNILTQCCMAPTHDPSYMTFITSIWSHIMGLVGLLTGLASGTTIVYMAKFEVEVYLRIIEKYKIEQLVTVPPILVAACKYPKRFDLSSVKTIYSGAAPLTKDLSHAVQERFPHLQAVLQGYGLSEAGLVLVRFNYETISISKPGSVGLVVPGVIIKVVDPNTRKPLGPNQQGEICVKGDVLMKGYIGRARSEDFDEEGFYKTGDAGYYDEHSMFFITDRLREWIKYKGFHVSPAQIEALLLHHDAVMDVGVVGIENKATGEIPMAFVVPMPGKMVTEQDIKDFVAKQLPDSNHLRGGVRFVQSIPKTPSGKIVRRELKKQVKPEKEKSGFFKIFSCNNDAKDKNK